MPIIQARVIKKPRVVRYCPECRKQLEGETIRLFGMAFTGDKPYPIFLHRACIISKDALRAIEEYELDKVLCEAGVNL